MKKAIQILTVLVILAAYSSGGLRATFAADPTFVGALAFAVDERGARRLGLSDEAMQGLLKLIDEREQEALRRFGGLRGSKPIIHAKLRAPGVPFALADCCQ